MQTTENKGNNKLKNDPCTETSPKKQLTCSGCKQPVDVLYQNDLCRSCLTQIFKKLTGVIDSVRLKQGNNL